MDTRITCSVKWIQRVVCREIQGTLPEARPASQTAKTPNSEHLQGARGIHTLRGRQNDEPSSGPLQPGTPWPLTHSVCQWRRCLSLLLVGWAAVHFLISD